MINQVQQDMEEDQVFEFSQRKRNPDIEASCNSAVSQLSRQIQEIHTDICAKEIEVKRVEAELVVMREKKAGMTRQLNASKKYLSELYGGGMI